MNSFILTGGGITILINGYATPFTVDKSHPNYMQIIDAVKAKEFSKIPDLIDLRVTMTKQFEQSNSELEISDDTIMFRGKELQPVLATRLLEMYSVGFDMAPMNAFLVNLYNNPSNRAVTELFGWIEANGITISEDGYLYAHKRVRDDFTSFHDAKTMNAVGTYVEMPRNEVDDRSDNTCSHGLHFCSQSYLPHYAGGEGQVLLLKINPADVVSIPTDYENAKGRACKYFVEAALNGDSRSRVEHTAVLKQAIVRDAEDVNASNEYKAYYKKGYADGRGKQRKYKSVEKDADLNDFENSLDQWQQCSPETYSAYEDGYTEGRAKQPKRFA